MTFGTLRRVLQLFPEGAFVAGSAAADPATAGDIDVWLPAGAPFDGTLRRRGTLRAIRVWTNPAQTGRVRSAWVDNFPDRDGECYKLQIFATDYATPDECVSDFDLSWSMWYYGGVPRRRERGPNGTDPKTGKLWVNASAIGPYTQQRVWKYLQRFATRGVSTDPEEVHQAREARVPAASASPRNRIRDLISSVVDNYELQRVYNIQRELQVLGADAVLQPVTFQWNPTWGATGLGQNINHVDTGITAAYQGGLAQR